jgi:hypothetical protein
MKFFETITALLIGLIWLLFNEPIAFLTIISVPLFFILVGVVISGGF